MRSRAGGGGLLWLILEKMAELEVEGKFLLVSWLAGMCSAGCLHGVDQSRWENHKFPRVGGRVVLVPESPAWCQNQHPKV